MSRETLREACDRMVSEGKATNIDSSVYRIMVEDPEALQRLADIDTELTENLAQIIAEGDRRQREAEWELRDFVIDY